MSASNATGGTLKFSKNKLTSVKNLDESNWVEYKYSMRFYLKFCSLLYLVEGTEKRENGLTISA